MNFLENLNLSKEWKEILGEELQKEYFKKLISFLNLEYSSKVIYPPKDKIFHLFNLIDYKDIKVVILGQDPYHGENQGNGIAFSVNPGIKIPPSLLNIFKELESEYPDFKRPASGDLSKWVKEGVFLINSVLTVENSLANSHKNRGWEIFTDEVIKKISQKGDVVFLLWGKSAIDKKSLIDTERNMVLTSSHPSPLSARRGFFGCNHFVESNLYLKSKGIKEIDWKL